MKVVKTKLTVLDLNPFQRFLDHHEIRGVFLGVYEERVNSHQVNNLIQYVYDNDNDTLGALVTLSLKYGSLEKAFLRARYTEREIEEMFSA